MVVGLLSTMRQSTKSRCQTCHMIWPVIIIKYKDPTVDFHWKMIQLSHSVCVTVNNAVNLFIIKTL